MTITWICLAVAVALAMEAWAAVMHGRLWHGLLWGVHASHHTDDRGLERNDIFAVLHAMPAAAMVYGGLAGTGWPATIALGVGAGMTAFGFAYFVVHDGYVHGRLPVGFLGRFRYMRKVKAAHVVHHRHGGAPFGLFSGPAVLEKNRG